MRLPNRSAGAQRRIGVALGAIVIMLIGAATAMVDPSRPGAYPSCPFRAVTGLQCPGCGSLRAMHDLTHGDLVGALDHNAVLVAVLLYATLRSAWVLVRPAATGGPGRPWIPRLVAGGLVLWTVARTLPMEPLTALAS